MYECVNELNELFNILCFATDVSILT